LATWLGVGAALVAAIGALIFNGVSACTANQQTDLGRQGQITDRYSKAVEQLGSTSIDVRLGGIYALERLMRDSHDDQPTIIEVLAAFIRNKVNKRKVPTFPPSFESAQRPDTDVLAAFTVLGRRNASHDAGHYVDLSRTNLTSLMLWGIDLVAVDLTYADLRGADLTGAKLAGAGLAIAKLTGASLSDADLVGADLSGADMSGANLAFGRLTGAALTGANLTGATIRRANLAKAILVGAILADADLTNATLAGANLTKANLTKANLTDADLTGANLTDVTGYRPSSDSPVTPTPRQS
jgi:uncharacterized protein YjbI with pentapeptide repeats